ncbi:MAG: hypothetical protein KJ941_09815 [Bacteroidetes bacterium]|nr:hypothetical protein [Bacteroidota bacterium]
MHYFFLGVACLIFGIYFVVDINVFFGVFFLYFSLQIILSMQGLTLDKTQHKFKPYFMIFPFKLGRWQKMAEFKCVQLSKWNSSSTFNHRGGSTRVKSNSYTISLVGMDGTRWELIDVVNYKLAIQQAEEVSQYFELPFENIYKDALEKALSKRQGAR